MNVAHDPDLLPHFHLPEDIKELLPEAEQPRSATGLETCSARARQRQSRAATGYEMCTANRLTAQHVLTGGRGGVSHASHVGISPFLTLQHTCSTFTQ